MLIFNKRIIVLYIATMIVVSASILYIGNVTQTHVVDAVNTAHLTGQGMLAANRGIIKTSGVASINVVDLNTLYESSIVRSESKYGYLSTVLMYSGDSVIVYRNHSGVRILSKIDKSIVHIMKEDSDPIIAFSKQGDIIGYEWQSGNIAVYSQNGKPKHKIKLRGLSEDIFIKYPKGICVSENGKYIYIFGAEY